MSAFILYMKSLIRKIVAGPKKKTPYNGQQLDLTYITDRIIAMAYPASNFLQQTYRNSIKDVANYFNQYHNGQYLIINVSSRPYDYSKFNNQVIEYKWPDHQAPPLTTLFQIANKAYNYLQMNEDNVIAVHCNHGKGRTGTAIINILLYLGIFKTASEALSFYNDRRFSSETYGVDQPCQTRYLNFVQNILSNNKINPKLAAFNLNKVSISGLHQKHCLSIEQVRDGKILVQKFNFFKDSTTNHLPIIGDFFIQIFEQFWPKDKQASRINYHTYFLQQELNKQSLKKNSITLSFRGQNIACNKSAEQRNFTLSLEFDYFCFCHLQGKEIKNCKCLPNRQIEQNCWKNMIQQNVQSKLISKKDRVRFLSVPLQQLQKQLEKDQECEQFQNVYELGKNMSNLNEEIKILGRINESTISKYQMGNTFDTYEVQDLQRESQGVQSFSKQRKRQKSVKQLSFFSQN